MESEVYIPLGCRQTLRAITMASADGLGSWVINSLSVQRKFLRTRLHVQLRVDFLAESMWKGCLWPHLACPVLIHMYIHKITVWWRKKTLRKSSSQQLMHLWHCAWQHNRACIELTLSWCLLLLHHTGASTKKGRRLDSSHWFSHVKYHFFQHLLHSFPSTHHILLATAWHPSSSYGLIFSWGHLWWSRESIKLKGLGWPLSAWCLTADNSWDRNNSMRCRFSLLFHLFTPHPQGFFLPCQLY